MKIEYVNQKGDQKIMQTSEVIIDLEGYNLRVYEANWGPAVQIIDKNSRKKLFDELGLTWIDKLKKGEA